MSDDAEDDADAVWTLNSVVQTTLSFLITSYQQPPAMSDLKKMGPLNAHVSTVLRHS